MLLSKLYIFFECILLILTIFWMVRRLIYSIASSKRRNDLAIRENDAELPYVDVIIPCKNEAAIIKHTLKHIGHANYPKDKLRIIVYDDASTDASKQIVMDLIPTMAGVELLCNPTAQSIGKASIIKQVVASPRKATVVWIIDADHRADPNCLIQALTLLQPPDVAAVGMSNRVTNGFRTMIATYGFIEANIHEMITAQAKDTLDLCPPLMGTWCAKKDALKAWFSGGWILNDDADFTTGIVASGLKTRFAKHAVTYHEVPETVSEYIRQHIRWNRGFHQVTKRKGLRLLRSRQHKRLVQRLETLLYSIGYFDRIFALTIGICLLISFFTRESKSLCLISLGLMLVTLLIQVTQVALRAGVKVWQLPRVYFALGFLLLDIGIAVWSLGASLSRLPLRWEPPQRHEVPQEERL